MSVIAGVHGALAPRDCRRAAENIYNLLCIDHFMVTEREPIPAGKHSARTEFKYDGAGLGKGGDVARY